MGLYPGETVTGILRFVINDLNGEKLLEHFMKKNCQREKLLEHFMKKNCKRLIKKNSE